MERPGYTSTDPNQYDLAHEMTERTIAVLCADDTEQTQREMRWSFGITWGLWFGLTPHRCEVRRVAGGEELLLRMNERQEASNA